jgi:cytochrome oxidase assembly protein ShyY1
MCLSNANRPAPLQHGSPIPGSVVISALKPRRPRNAPAVLVNRGWAPDTWSEPAGGTCLKCAGVVRVSETRSAFTPDNVPAANTWHWVDVPAVVGLYKLNPVYTHSL